MGNGQVNFDTFLPLLKFFFIRHTTNTILWFTGNLCIIASMEFYSTLLWDLWPQLFLCMCNDLLEYLIVKLFSLCLIVFVCCSICELAGVYREGEFRGDAAFPYMIAVNNFSQFIAMYCLVLFYKANKEELLPMKPIGKFLCIKAVVFFSFL